MPNSKFRIKNMEFHTNMSSIYLDLYFYLIFIFLYYRDKI